MTTTHPEPTIIAPSGLDLAWLDSDAHQAVRRLQEKGHEAYLVGGCVRDLLLGRSPKDFDIATSARPQNVKRTFPRNCRIIGRRFKLAHLHFHRNTKILEVSTFRRTPEDQDEGDDLLIKRDNEFGSAEEDALRRDFTMNALFFDPVEDRLIDYVGGIQDVEKRLVRTIGDPEVRFREDPVRILRAVKFAGRLGFRIDDDCFAAMRAVAPDLKRSAPPRLLEEVLRLLRGGHAFASFRLLHEIGALGVILPDVARYYDTADADERTVFWRLLDSLDEYILSTGSHPPGGVLLGTLFVRPVLQQLAQADGGAIRIAEDLLSPFIQDLRLPRRDAGCLKRICGLQPRLSGTDRRKTRPASLARTPFFEEALLLFELSAAASGEGIDELPRWRAVAGEGEAEANGAPALLLVDPLPRRSFTMPGAARIPTRTRPEPQRAGGEEEPAGRSKKKRKRRDRKGRNEGDGRRGPRADQPKSKKTKPKKDKPRRGVKRDRREVVEEIEPTVVDTSFFDKELDARRPPSFGTPLEGAPKKKRARLPSPEEDDYKPPPPPGGDSPAPGGGDDAPPPPPGGGGLFGDW